MNGASSPVSTMIPSTTRAMRDDLARRIRRTPRASGDSRGRGALMGAKSWVCPGIEEIGENASECYHDASEDHSTDDERVVASADGVDDGEAHSRPGEDFLNEKRAGEESGEGEPDETDDGKECVAQRMSPENLAFGQSL